MNEQNGRWVTINGAHVFIKDGQSPMDAFIRQKGKGNRKDEINQKVDEAIDNVDKRNERQDELTEEERELKEQATEVIEQRKEMEKENYKESLNNGDITQEEYDKGISTIEDIKDIEDLYNYEMDMSGEASENVQELYDRVKELDKDIFQNDVGVFKSKVGNGSKEILNTILDENPELQFEIENSDKSNSFYVKFKDSDGEDITELRVSDHVRPPKKTSQGYVQHVYDAQYVPDVQSQDDLGRPEFFGKDRAIKELRKIISEYYKDKEEGGKK